MPSALAPWQLHTLRQSTQMAYLISGIALGDNAASELTQLTHETAIRQAGPYHDGSWEVISLIAPDGDPERQFVKRGDVYKPTPILDRCTSIKGFLDTLPGELRRVRLSRLRAAGSIEWHVDDFEEKTDERIFRIHIPIVSAPENFQIISHSAMFWDVGEAWLGDYRFPHKVINASRLDRLHLIIDLKPSDAFIQHVNLRMNIDWFGQERRLQIDATKSMLMDWRNSARP